MPKTNVDVSFSYDPHAENGPSNWGKLPIDDNQCDGTSNSPIAIQTYECDRYEDYILNNGSCTISDLEYQLTNTGVKASYPSSSTLSLEPCQPPQMEIPGISGTYYKAIQFHIHTSSEHTIDGKHYGAELHIVHQQEDEEGSIIGDDDHKYSIIGMMIEPTAKEQNVLFQHLLDGWAVTMENNDIDCGIPISTRDGHYRRRYCRRQQQVDEVGSILGDSRKRHLTTTTMTTTHDESSNGTTTVFSPYMLIPKGSTYYHYDGGLTTPPCSEVVWWNFVDQVISITPSQYEHLVEDILDYIDPSTCQYGSSAGPAGMTSRPIQPLNGQYVDRICLSSSSFEYGKDEEDGIGGGSGSGGDGAVVLREESSATSFVMTSVAMNLFLVSVAGIFTTFMV